MRNRADSPVDSSRSVSYNPWTIPRLTPEPEVRDSMKRFALLLLAALALAASCGREAPVGTLDVTSDPEGLLVTIVPVGETAKTSPALPDVTPVRKVLPVGRYRILPDYAPDQQQVTPASREVEVTAAQRQEARFSWTALGQVTVTSGPAGAAIWIDGADTGEVTPATLILPEGEHRIRLVLDGYWHTAYDYPFTVDPQTPRDMPFTLTPAGELVVSSAPAGARIWLGMTDTGAVTPDTLTLGTGVYTVRVSRDGYLSQPDSLDVEILQGAATAADFTLISEGSLGDLTVTSRPSGAAILLDGEDSGEVTPHTFTLPPTAVSVSVLRDGFLDAAAQTATPAAGGAAADFALTARKVSLVETMSGVLCVGCPAMNTMLANVEASYGHDVLLGVKYSGPFGGPDPFYNANPTVLQARMTTYANGTPWNWAAPTLFLDGDLPVAPAFNNGYPSYGEMAVLLNDAAALDPGFAIAVHVADWSADPLDVTVTLASGRDVTLPAHDLNLAVAENPIVFDTEQNDAGETEFHWICREFATLESSPGRSLGADPATLSFQVAKQANWTDVLTENLYAIVFVQEPGTLRILQAGAQAPATHAIVGRTRP